MAELDPWERESPINDKLLDAVRAVESDNGRKLVSPKGALGPYQFMPPTAKEYGIDPMDEKQSREAARKFLQKSYDKHGSTDLALASYNWGPGNVDRWLDKGGPIPDETSGYVQKVTQLAGAPNDALPGNDPWERAAPPAPQKKTAGDILAGPPIKIGAEARSADMDPNASASSFVLNKAKLGLMAVPGALGNIEAAAGPLKAFVNEKMGITPDSLLGAADKFLSPIPWIEGGIKAMRQMVGQESATAMPTSEELATKLLGYDKTMKPPSRSARLVGEGTEIAASMAGGPLASLAKGAVGVAARKAVEAAGLSAAAVGGGQAAQSMFGEGEGTKVAGELASIIPYAVARKWFNPKQSAEAVKSAVSGEGSEVNALFQRQAEAQLQKGMQEYPASVANVREASGLQQKVNDALAGTDQSLSLSAGRASGSPRIIADELTARRSSPAAVSAALDADSKNAGALLTYMTNDTSPAAMSRKAALDRVVNDYNTRLQGLRAQEETVRSRASSLAESLQPAMTAEQRGAGLVEQRVVEKAKQDAISNQLYGAARNAAVSADARFASSGIEGVAESMAKNPILSYDSANLPNVVRNIRSVLGNDVQDEAVQAMKITNPDKAEQLRQRLAKLGDLQEASTKRDNLTFDDITAMRKAVNQDITGELSSTNPNKRQRLRSLTEMKDTIDGAIAESSHEDVKRLYGAANEYYKTTYSPMFNKGINAKLAMTDSYGQARVMDENVLDQYMGSASGAGQFVTLFGKNPEAMAIMEDHMLDRFSKAAVKDGVIDNRARLGFVTKNLDVLKKLDAAGMPVLKNIADVGKTAQALADRQALIVMQGEKIAKDQLTRLFGTVNLGDLGAKMGVANKIPALNVGSNHQAIVEKALTDPAAMGRLTNALGQEGSKALASSVLRSVGRDFTFTADSGRLGINHQALSKWLADNQVPLKVMFRAAYGPQDGEGHLQRLQDANRMLAIQDRVPTTKLAEGGSNIGKDPLSQKVGISFRTFFNLFRAVKGGRTSEADAAVALGGQAGSYLMTKQYNALMQRIATDPESSKYLLTLAQDGTKRVLSGADVKRQAAALSGLIGKLGYIYAGGRYYGPSLRALAPILLEQKTQGAQ